MSDDLCLTMPCASERPQVPFREAEIDRDVINFISKIDEGNFGEVWLARIQSVEVAVKVPHGSANLTDFISEAEKMHAMWHPQLVQFMGFSTKPEGKPLLLVTEYMKNKSLKGYLKTPAGQALSEADLLSIMDQVCRILI